MNNSRLNNKIKRESWAATKANASLNNLSPTDVDALIAQYLIDNPVGGGGLPQLEPRFASESQQIAYGSTGNLLLITPPTGQRVRLVFMQAQGNIDQHNITIEVGGIDAVTNKTLSNAYYGPVGTFCVGHPVGNGAGAPRIGSAGAIPAITGKTDEAIRVYRTTGVATTRTIYYSYQLGI